MSDLDAKTLDANLARVQRHLQHVVAERDALAAALREIEQMTRHATDPLLKDVYARAALARSLTR